MAFAGSVKKPSRVVRTLKLMKSRFLLKPESQILFSRRTKLLFETSKGDQPLHQRVILGKFYHTLTSLIYSPVNSSTTAKFHHLAENALTVWAMCNKNEVVFKPTDPECISGLRNCAKDIDSKGAPPTIKKKELNSAKVADTTSAQRFAEAKRLLKERRVIKEINNPKRSPFEEP